MSTETGTSPILGLMGFWMMMGLVSTLTLVLGGLYTLYCMSRYASSMDRLASAVEELVKRQQDLAASTSTHPHAPPVRPAPVPPVPSSGPASAAVVPAPSAASYNPTGTNPTAAAPPAASSSVGGTNANSGTNAERQSDEYPR
jgi:hypothetical protein